MGQPNPPGDIPLYEGLSPEWNDFVGALPEEKRAELAPKFKERIDAYENKLKPWENFTKSGITPEFADTAVGIYSMIENQPRQVLDAMAKHLGLTVSEVQQAVETMQEQEEEEGEDPRIKTLTEQVNTLTKIAFAQREQETQQATLKEAEAELEKEFKDLRGKYGDDVDEEEVIMRMVHKSMTAEQAYLEYTGKLGKVRPPAPRLLGGGGNVPQRAIDPTKLDSASTKSLVAQMMQHAANQK